LLHFEFSIGIRTDGRVEVDAFWLGGTHIVVGMVDDRSCNVFPDDPGGLTKQAVCANLSVQILAWLLAKVDHLIGLHEIVKLVPGEHTRVVAR
jgi:hypothetical protein